MMQVMQESSSRLLLISFAAAFGVATGLLSSGTQHTLSLFLLPTLALVAGISSTWSP